ncbi:MAG: tetratricopeptide repeat protein [Hormoscilla sp. GUM202]|nr:tetratricopeptide repeat protein [Hormoscilla sp. GUM202]
MFAFPSYRRRSGRLGHDRAIQIKPDCYEAWYNRGNLLARLQDYESALIDYDKAIAIEPEKY